MTYANIIPGTFICRPNRFIAHVEVAGEIEIAHVKNTGRCTGLLSPGVPVYLETHNDETRKTKFSLIAVQKGERLVNMDSQAPNKIWREALNNGIALPGFDGLTLVKQEVLYGKSRLDFYVEGHGKGKHIRAYMEVKGVTLEENDAAFFPDAPTERGVKHIHELMRAASCGYLAYVVFIVKMQGIQYFSPNDKIHPAFGDALRAAAKKGVTVLAYDCHVAPHELLINAPVPIIM